MLIVGELINASRKTIGDAIAGRDAAAIEEVAKAQALAGADYIDVNAGKFRDGEAGHLKWLVKVVQGAVDLPCCLDSPNPAVIEAALTVHRGKPMINSISLEKKRFDSMIPFLAGSEMEVVALCTSDAGMPQTVQERLDIAEHLVEGLTKNNVQLGNIHIDPLVQPISVDTCFGADFLSAVKIIMERYDGLHTVCGLSNVSYGLPRRALLNRIFMAMAIANGLDGAIVNPLDQGMMTTISAAEALGGRDEYCSAYLTDYRKEKLA